MAGPSRAPRLARGRADATPWARAGPAGGAARSGGRRRPALRRRHQPLPRHKRAGGARALGRRGALRDERGGAGRDLPAAARVVRGVSRVRAERLPQLGRAAGAHDRRLPAADVERGAGGVPRPWALREHGEPALHPGRVRGPHHAGRAALVGAGLPVASRHDSTRADRDRTEGQRFRAGVLPRVG